MSDNQPLVSVIMNCLNCEKYLKEAIDSVYSQTYSIWEIIFWDNASTDNSSKIAKRYDEKLRYFKGEKTIPLGAARNEAIRQAKGEYIAFLDCDDLWMPEKLEKQIPLFDDPEVGLVYSNGISFSRNNSNIIYGKSGYFSGMCFSNLLSDYRLCMSSVAIRKSAMGQGQDWFDPTFEMIEEFDFFIRISYQWKLNRCLEPLVKIRVHSSSMTWSKPVLIYREKEKLLKKYDKIFPDFSTTYYKERNALKLQIMYSHALKLWREGKGAEARYYLQNYRFKIIKIFLFYYITFCPSKIFYSLTDKIRRKTRPIVQKN